MEKVICISGKAGSGKDTTAELIRAFLEDDGYKVLITHYADLVKYVCKNFLAWDGKKDEFGRRMLQYVGTEFFRDKKSKDYWVNFVADCLDLVKELYDFVIIPDARFENEINVLSSRGYKVFYVNIERPDREEMRKDLECHSSESGIKEIVPDFNLVNDGSVVDLVRKVQNLVSKLKTGTTDCYSFGECVFTLF